MRSVTDWRYRRTLALLLLLALSTASGSTAQSLRGTAPELPRSLDEVAAATDLPALVAEPPATPTAFEENRGQHPAYIAYLWGGDTLILDDGSTVVLSDLQQASRPGTLRASTLRTELVGAARSRAVGRRAVGRRAVAGQIHYLRGSSSRSAVGVRRYGEVVFSEVYPHVDLIYRDLQGTLKYDFLVRPGGDPSAIRLRFHGAESLVVDDRGNLVVETGGRQVIHRRPEVFSLSDNGRRPVSASYRVGDEKTVDFVLGAWDRQRELLIDPEIVYSTYLGGSQTLEEGTCTLSSNEGDVGNSVAVDSQGRAVVVGQTCAIDFPTENPFQGDLASVSFESQTDAFVTRFAADGQSLDFSTYLGGGEYDVAEAVALGPGDAITVAGSTLSEDFPLMDALFDELSLGISSAIDAFVTVLAGDGQSLLFSTYLGGSDEETGDGVAVGTDGAIAVVGSTSSEDFPEQDAFQSHVDQDDAFVTLIEPGFSGLTFSTVLGSAEDDEANDVAIDLTGRVVLIGTTRSGPFGADLFPTVNALKATNDNFLTEAFLARFEADGQPVFITLLGGTDNDEGRGVAINPQGQIYAVGTTGGELFPEPTADAYQPGHGGISDTFVVKVDAGGQNVLYSTYYGGPASELVEGVAVDAYGAAVIAGEVTGDGLPVLQAPQDEFGGDRDVFVAKLSTEGDALLFGTYLGGADDDAGRDVAVDAEGSTYVTGFSASDDFPVLAPFQGTLAGTLDVIVTKLGESLADFRYEYATKVICGEQPEPRALTLARGAYATTVNVHRPGRERAVFRKKLALSIPPGFQRPGDIVPISFDRLDYDEALASGCDDLRQRLEELDPDRVGHILDADYFEGFLVLQSSEPLDVTAVYSTADLDGTGGDDQGLAADNASIDVEEVSERDRIEPTDLLITKQALLGPTALVTDVFEYFTVGYLVSVSNLGAVDAYDLLVKDFLTWEGAIVVVPLPDTFVVGGGGTLTVDSILPVLGSQGSIEMTGTIPQLATGATTALAFWTIGVRRLPDQSPTTLVNTVFLGSAGEDPNPANNTAVVVTDF